MDLIKTLEQLDSLYAKSAVSEADAFLASALEQAEREQDEQVLLSLLNEQMGLYRVTGRQSRAVELSGRALALVESLGLTGSAFHATVLLNRATALCVDGQPDLALETYRRAETIYEIMGAPPFEYASLLNNMSSIYSARGELEAAEACLKKSRELLADVPDTEAELATNAVNLSMLAIRQGKQGEAEGWIQTAMEYYDHAGQTDTHRASAIAARGMLAFSRGQIEQALRDDREALTLTLEVFGESHDARILRQNIDQLEKELNKRYEGT